MRVTKEQKAWVDITIGKIEEKMFCVAERNLHKIPYTAKDGMFNDYSESKICWWTNGFWPGIMWQMYQLTKEELYRKAAREAEEGVPLSTAPDIPSKKPLDRAFRHGSVQNKDFMV